MFQMLATESTIIWTTPVPALFGIIYNQKDSPVYLKQKVMFWAFAGLSHFTSHAGSGT